MNPLLDFSGLPRFADIQPEHVAPAIKQILADYGSVVRRCTGSAATWNDFAQPLVDASEQLSRAWGIVGHLHSVNDVPAWREAYNATLPEVTRFSSELAQNPEVFAGFKALRASGEYARLTPARQRIVDNEIRDFRLGGAELPAADKPRFLEIQQELAALGAKFSENLLDATNAHSEWVSDEAGLAGLPDDVRTAARAAAEATGKPGWRFSLQAPSYLPVMQYAEDRALRQRMYRAYATRASDQGDPTWDNGPLIGRMLALRAEEAALLGYDNYAEISLVPKMADTPAQVESFLEDLAQRARPFGQRDLHELQAFARTDLAMTALEPWDLAWASEKLKQARYAFSDEEVKQYFPEPQVLSGLFRVVESLFSVTIAPSTAPVWHPDVRYFSIQRGEQPIGGFYLDLYARETKRGGAWMDEAITRRRIASGLQLPVAYLNCNFPAPAASGQAATFSHDDVITLFHEFGHGLHHLLTQVEDLPVSGIHGVEWDAVELPSQFMENFCWEWPVLQGMTRHARTGEPLPRVLYERMLAAKNFQSGMHMLRQLEFGLFDLRIHCRPVKDIAGVLAVLEQVRQEVAVVMPPAWHRFPHGFSHIFGGGYAAGYYSYKWAEVLSADAYAAFEEAAGAEGSTLDAQVGNRFWQEILAVGGSRPAMESFRAFRGRAPQVEALLRHNGMILA